MTDSTDILIISFHAGWLTGCTLVVGESTKKCVKSVHGAALASRMRRSLVGRLFRGGRKEEGKSISFHNSVDIDIDIDINIDIDIDIDIETLALMTDYGVQSTEYRIQSKSKSTGILDVPYRVRCTGPDMPCVWDRHVNFPFPFLFPFLFPSFSCSPSVSLWALRSSAPTGCQSSVNASAMFIVSHIQPLHFKPCLTIFLTMSWPCAVKPWPVLFNRSHRSTNPTCQELLMFSVRTVRTVRNVLPGLPMNHEPRPSPNLGH